MKSFRALFSPRPRLDTGGTGNQALQRMNAPPMTDVRGNGGRSVMRSFLSMQPGFYIPQQTLTQRSITGGGTTIGGDFDLTPLTSKNPVSKASM